MRRVANGPSVRIRAALACTVWMFLGLGCASTRLQQESLPEQPIAFLHWEDRAAKSRSTAFGSVSELPPPPENKFDPRGARNREIAAYLRAEHSSILSAKLAKKLPRLKLYWPRSGKLENVEAAPLGARPLAWSTDHRKLLFVSTHRESKRQLYEYHLERKDLSTVTFGDAEHVRGDYDSAGGLAILRIERGSRDTGDHMSVHLASSGGRLGEEIVSQVHPGTLRLAPQGEYIVYEQIRARPRSVGATIFDSFIASHPLAPGTEEKLLAKGREPVLTPDGEWIVFASPSSAGYRLRRMRPDGTSRVPIGPGGTEERMPAVSPDGNFIAFIKDTGESRRLYVRSYDGKKERGLLLSGWSEFPVW